MLFISKRNNQKELFKMFTREQMMAHECTHGEYYKQFVTPYYINAVNSYIGSKKIHNSTNEFFNDIPLKKWDTLAQNIMVMNKDREKLKAAGETYTLGTMVCILKQAARMIKNEETHIV